MSNQNQFFATAYGFNQPLDQIFPLPIVAKRAPTTADRAPIGQLWVEPSVNGLWILSSIANNLSTWTVLEAGGGAGVFSSIVVNPGPSSFSTVGNGAFSVGNATNTGAITMTVGSGNMSIVGAGHSITIGNDAAANAVTLGSLTNGAVTIIDGGNGTGVGSAAIQLVTAAAGDIEIGAASHSGAILLGNSTVNETISIGTGAASANTISVGGTGANVIAIGNTQVGGSVTIGNAMVAGTIKIGGAAMTGTISVGNSTAGQIINVGNAAGADTINIGNANAGNLTNLASPITALPGPVYIYTGAGAPGAGLALHVGDLYINTTAASATTRMYIATAASTWTNFTCAA